MFDWISFLHALFIKQCIVDINVLSDVQQAKIYPHSLYCVFVAVIIISFYFINSCPNIAYFSQFTALDFF